MAGKDRWPLLTGRFALLLLIPCLVLPLAPSGQAWLWWLGLNAVLLVVAAVDWRTSPGSRDLRLTVQLKGYWVRGEAQPIRLSVENLAREAVALDLVQDLPRELGGPMAPPLRLQAAAGETAEGAYETRPVERGDFHAADVHGRWRSRLGLLVKRGLWPQAIPVRVYAPLYIDKGPGLLAPQQRVQEQGLALVRAAGVHTEFESLREYREGDELRAVNWLASARRGHMVVNQYQAERTQQVMLMLDAGRLMVPEYRSIPRFEYALTAALQLGRLAAEREDRVGMMIMGADRDVMLPPARGQAQVTRMAEAAYRVKPQMIEPDYAGALARLSGSIKRRSLVLVFTDLVSPEASGVLVEQLVRLVPRHLVAVIAISDPAVTALVSAGAATAPEAFAQASADWVLAERAAAKAPLLQKGIAVMDVPPLGLSSAAVNKYLAVKRQGLL